MKVGRELDALVAEKVMGLPITDFTKTACQPYYSWGGEYTNIHYAPNNEPYVVTGVEKAGCPQVRRIDDYSTSIADAWQVVEKLRERNVISISCMINRKWRCEIVQAESAPQQPINAFADTAPLAICLAALAATGVDIDSPK